MSLMKKPLGMESIIISFSSLICRLLVLAKPWRNLWSAQTVVFCTLDTYVCLVLWWSAGEVKMETTEPAAISPVAAQCIQMCFLLRDKVQRDLVCLWGLSTHVCMQFCRWYVCGQRGIQSEGHVVVMSAMWTRGQGEAFGLLFAILTSEPAAIPAHWSIGLSVASNCLPWQLQTKKLKIAKCLQLEELLTHFQWERIILSMQLYKAWKQHFILFNCCALFSTLRLPKPLQIMVFIMMTDYYN